MFEAPMSRMGLVGVRDQFRVLFPRCSCLEKRSVVVGRRWVGMRGSIFRGGTVVRTVSPVGAGPYSGVVLLVSGRLRRGLGSVVPTVVASERVLLHVGGRGVLGVSC